MSLDELITCPGGCGTRLSPRAQMCPKCGHRHELAHIEQVLSGLGTICSILIGFGLSALVTLATDETNSISDPVVSVAAGLWLVSSLLLLFVLVATEWIRGNNPGSDGIGAPFRPDSGTVARCALLLYAFFAALLCTAVGVSLIAFHFSLVLGAIAVVTLLLVIAGSVMFFRARW